MTSHRNIVFSITLLTVAAATMFYGVSTIHKTNKSYTSFPEQQPFDRPSADNQTINTNYSTKQLSISQQHRISHKAMQSSQRSYSPHSLYQHSSAMTASSCVAVPLQPSTNNITVNKGQSSMSERTYSLVLPSLQRGSIIAGTPSAAPYLAVASTPQSSTPLVQYAPVIGGGIGSVWQQWLDEYYATGATDLSGLEAWWYEQYGDGYTPDIYTDFAQWAVPLNDANAFCILLAITYLLWITMKRAIL